MTYFTLFSPDSERGDRDRTPERTTTSTTTITDTMTTQTITTSAFKRGDTDDGGVSTLQITSITQKTPEIASSEREDDMILAKTLKWKTCIRERQIPGTTFYVICEWIRVFVRWRWKTFKSWTDLSKLLTMK